MNTGNVAIILNAHFPYVRRAGRWPHGEESLHGVIAESYVPLLAMLYELRSSGRALPLTVSVSPVLLEQLADPVIVKHMTLWLAEWRGRLMGDLARFEAAADGHGVYLARFYIDWLDVIEGSFAARFDCNLVAATRSLLRDSSELLLAPATFAYLPQLTPAELRAQLEVGALTVLRHLGRRPTGLWLPGGGLPRLVAPLAAELGLRYAVGAPHAATASADDGPLPTLHPDGALSQYVVGSGIGYPGDGVYRDFYRQHPESGIHYWRVTGSDVSQDAKALYDPYLAFQRVEEHAAHFVQAVRDRLRAPVADGTPPAVVVAFDVDLFGHWWFEGVRWLQSVLEGLLAAEDVQLTTAQHVYRRLPAALPAPVAPHPIFDAPAVLQLRERVAAAAARLASVARHNPAAEGLTEDLLGQATRELLLAQSSDWPVLIAADMAEEYAHRRLSEHLARFDQLLRYAERTPQSADAAHYLREVADLDNPFPVINYRLFR